VANLIFLFGAGASHGAGDIIPEAPPLGFQLYRELSKIYPMSWGSLPSSVGKEFEKNFEFGMEIVYDKYSQIVAELMRQLATYFIQFRPYSGSSLYCKLIKILREQGLLGDVVFSTINYDCILEFSLIKHGIQFTYDHQNISSLVPVWKLHGSCNMFSKQLKVSPGISFTKGIVFEGGVEAFLDIGTVVENCLSSGLYPLMCLYMRGKPLQISPSFVQKIQQQWQKTVSDSKIIMCVGIKPLPEDEHIWNSLGKTSAYLYFIGSQQDFKSWTTAYRKNFSEYISHSFNSGFSVLERRLIQYAAQRRR